MTVRSKKPSRMKPWKGWATVDEDGYGSDVFPERRSAQLWAESGCNQERIVRVEVRELVKPKKEKKAR